MTQPGGLLQKAEELARLSSSWADLSNRLFDPVEGLLARAFSTRDERRQFIETAEFRAVQQLLNDAIARFGLAEGATPQRLTEFMVQLQPTSAEHSPTFRVASAG